MQKSRQRKSYDRKPGVARDRVGSDCPYMPTTIASMAFDDSFALWDPSSLPATLFVSPPNATGRARRNATAVMTTADSVAAAIVAETGGDLPAVATGTATLDVWSDCVARNESRKQHGAAAI